MHHGLIATALGMRDQRVSAPGDRHESTVDAGPRPKGRRGNLSHQTEFEPRPPLGGHHRRAADGRSATGDFPLHQQHRIGPSGPMEDASQYRRRQMKR